MINIDGTRDTVAPDIIEAILDGRSPLEMRLDDLFAQFAVYWTGTKGGAHR